MYAAEVSRTSHARNGGILRDCQCSSAPAEIGAPIRDLCIKKAGEGVGIARGGKRACAWQFFTRLEGIK